jgi:hypothetical protein
MSWLQTSVLTIPSMARAIQTAQLRKIVGDRGEVAKNQPNVFGSLDTIGNPFWHKL